MNFLYSFLYFYIALRKVFSFVATYMYDVINNDIILTCLYQLHYKDSNTKLEAETLWLLKSWTIDEINNNNKKQHYTFTCGECPPSGVKLSHHQPLLILEIELSNENVLHPCTWRLVLVLLHFINILLIIVSVLFYVYKTYVEINSFKFDFRWCFLL